MASLIRLAQAGELSRADEVWVASGWVRAEDVTELRPHLKGDPWSAWQDIDDVDAAKLYERMVERGAAEPRPEDEPEDLPVEALTPVPEGAGPRVLVVRRDSSTAPEPAAPLAPPPRPDHARGELIDFPRAYAPPPVPERVSRPSTRRPGPPPLVRASRVASFVLAGGVLLLIGYGWISFGGSSRIGVEAVEPPAAVTAAPLRVPAAPDPLARTESELRNQLPPDTKRIREAGDLNDALLLELVQLGVQVGAVDAPVTKWAGRKQDDPRAAEIRIRFTARPEIERDLGAIALVVGRYKRTYRLDIPVFDLTEETTGGHTLVNAEQAEAFYMQRVSLTALLAGIAAP